MMAAVKILLLLFIGSICLAPFTDGGMLKKYRNGGRRMTRRQMGSDRMPVPWQYRYYFGLKKFTADDEDVEDGSGSGSGDGKSDIEDFPTLIYTPRPSETTIEKNEGESNPVSKSQSISPPSHETKKISTTSKIPDGDQSTSSEKTKPEEVTVSNSNEPLPKNKNTQLKSSIGTPEKEEGREGLSQQAIYIIVGSVSGGIGLILLIAMAIVHSIKKGQDGYKRSLV